MESSIKALHKNIAEWLAGPAGSVLLHLSLILALLFLVDFSKKPTDEPTVEITYMDVQTKTLDPDPPVITPPPEFANPSPTLAPPDANVDLPPAPEVFEFSQKNPTDSAPTLDIPPIESSIIMTKIMAGPMATRVGQDAQETAGRLHGGAGWKYAAVAVERALEWLRMNQNAEGSWGTNDKEAMTGLAILTFLAHGETTSSEKYGETVKRAIQYLVARQNANGAFAKMDTTAGTYSQAICVYALSEAYGMTRILDLKTPMESGVELLIQGQQANGGFDYRFEKSARRDTSLGGWCSQALKAAFIAGAGNPRLKQAMDLAVADMKSVQKEDGSFYYSDSGSHTTHGITAVGVLSLQLLGHVAEKEAVHNGLDYLRAVSCDWKNPPEWPMYAWYYISQTKFHQGGDSWTKWNSAFAPQFIRSQNSDGSWDSAGLALKAGANGRENMHPVYATTLAALTLQVYWRNLPTFKPIEEQAVEQKPNDEVTVSIL